MKKNLLFLVVILLSFRLLADNFKVGSIYYNVLKGKNVEVTLESNDQNKNYYGLKAAEIPATVENNGTTYQVVAIGDRAFAGCKTLRSITIPENITTINSSALEGCSNLVDVVWNVRNYSNSKKESNGPLNRISGSVKSITFGDKVTNVPDALCFDMVKLTEVNMNVGIKTIGNKSFSGCRALENINLGSNIKSIGKEAFYNCVSLKKIVIPQSVSSIDGNTFEGCSSLQDVLWEPVSYNVKKESDAPFYALRKQIKSITFGDKVKSVPAYFCSGMDKIESVILPGSMNSIEHDAFNGCSALKTLELSNNVQSIGAEAFAECTVLSSVVIGNSVKSLGAGAFEDCRQLSLITLGTGIKELPKEVFKNCQSLDSIYIPKTITKIGEEAFEDCVGLSKIVFNEGLLSVGKESFKNCKSLTSVVLPQSLTSIGESAFEDCEKLVDINVPAMVKTVAKSAFYSCKSLITVNLAEGVKELDKDAFKGCQSLKTLVIPSTITSISKSTFADCVSLSEIVWNPIAYGDVKKAEDGPFAIIASQIKSFTFGENVTRIPMQLCANMVGLTEISLPASVTSIGKKAFIGCTSLSKVIFGNPGALVEDGAFEETTELQR